MIKSKYIFILTAFAILSCSGEIKNDEARVEVEPGTEVEESTFEEEAAPIEWSEMTSDQQEEVALVNRRTRNDTMEFWVGYFEPDDSKSSEDHSIYVDEGFYWNRQNKINISIDKIKDTIVEGHSVVAGNDRPFTGTVKNGVFHVKEPGDDKYDGTFTFEIVDQKLIGKWSAFKNIEIKHRKYELEKKTFYYNPDVMLEETNQYINWNKYKEEKELVEYDENEFEEWISREYASSTRLIYSINASNTLLKKADVENLKKGDLTIIRNTIYARHGYSFKNRPLRVFFDAQSWYIPVHTDIKADFTEIEKENIKLLLRYEENAAEYYDYFGRG